MDLWILPLSRFADERESRVFLQTPFTEIDPRFSPNGRWMAYLSDEAGGTLDVYVTRFPARDRKWRVSVGSADDPQWRHDGKELFFESAGKLMAVDVSGIDNSAPGVPVGLFEARMPTAGLGHYAVAANGQRFLVNELQTAGAARITVVVNWTSILRK
jgi:hypothetical protein